MHFCPLKKRSSSKKLLLVLKNKQTKNRPKYLSKEGRCERHLKYIWQNQFSYLVSMQWTNKVQLTAVSSWQAYQVTAAS